MKFIAIKKFLLHFVKKGDIMKPEERINEGDDLMATSTIEQDIVLRGDNEADYLLNIFSNPRKSDYKVERINIEKEMKDGLELLKQKYNL